MKQYLIAIQRVNRSLSRKIMAIGGIAAFALVGTIVLQFSGAATNGIAIEAESVSGSLQNAVAISDAEASGGQAVFFGTTPTPTPTPNPSGTPTPTPTPIGQIPLDQLPKGNPGSGAALIQGGAPSGSPTPTSTSAFRIECGFSHMNYDDAIVYPGQQGKAHLHTYFGNTGANYTSTYQTLMSSGNSTCSGGILNRSAYWVPTLMNGTTPIAPVKVITYYKSGWPSVPFSTIQNLPNGLKMITGNANASSNQNPAGRTFIEWHCNSAGSTTVSMPTCNAGDEVVLIIGFPQCWDGVNLDSIDHKAHVAMPQSYSGSGCPSTHPVPLPHIEFIVHWPVASGTSAGYRLSSDNYSTTIPGGFSAHADYMEGWDIPTKTTFVQQCLVVGKDCQVRWLGDGRTLLNPAGVN